MNILTPEQKKKIEELSRRWLFIKTQLQTEGINLTALWNCIIASFNMFAVAGIVLFMFPEGPWSDDYARGFAIGAFLVFMVVSPNLIYCAKYIIKKVSRKNYRLDTEEVKQNER